MGLRGSLALPWDIWRRADAGRTGARLGGGTAPAARGGNGRRHRPADPAGHGHHLAVGRPKPMARRLRPGRPLWRSRMALDAAALPGWAAWVLDGDVAACRAAASDGECPSSCERLAGHYRGMKRRRFLVLHLPLLATDHVRRREPALAGRPLATWATHGNRRVLTGVDACGATLKPGQALADAQAMHPELVLRPANPDVIFQSRLQ